MNVYVWVLLTALGVAAGTSWAAIGLGRRELEQLTRPAVAVLLLAVAWLLRADTVGYGRLLLLGLVLGLLAEALARWGRWPTAATVALLASRAGWLAAAAGLPPGEGPVWLGVVLVVLAAAAVGWTRLVPALRRNRPEGARRAGYAALVAAVPLAAWLSGHVVAGWGATLLAAGDALAAYDRSVQPVPSVAGSRVAVVAAHDVAAVLLVVGMLRA